MGTEKSFKIGLYQHLQNLKKDRPSEEYTHVTIWGYWAKVLCVNHGAQKVILMGQDGAKFVVSQYEYGIFYDIEKCTKKTINNVPI